MDTVAARASVSKATIYAHFDNKRALFEQVIEGRCQRIFGTFDIPEHISDARVALRQLAVTLSTSTWRPRPSPSTASWWPKLLGCRNSARRILRPARCPRWRE